jgi:hypothetical protein
MSAAPSRARLLLLLCLIAGNPLGGGEAPAASAPGATPTESPLLRETRQYVAQLTEQRNQLRDENDTLRGRQGLLLIYGGVLTLLSGFLAYRVLTRPATKPKASDTDAFPVATTVTVRKNATITIRNSGTQQAEVTDQVQTRRAFARSDTATQTRQPGTRPITRRESRATGTPTPPPAAVVAPELDPNLPAVPSTTRRHANPRTTVRVEQQSDRLAPVEVGVKPGTAPVRRATSGS